MKIIAFLALFVAILSVVNAIPVKNIEEFVLGFAEGVEVTFDDFEAAMTDLEDGFKNKSLSLLSQGVEELGAGIDEVSQVLIACDVGTIGQDIQAIAQQLKSGPSGILDFIVKESINIFHNKHDVTADFKTAIAAWKAGNFTGSGEAVGSITGILLED